MITLETLERAARRGLLNLSGLSRALGLGRSNLRLRIRREGPEITEVEAERIREELARDGIKLEGT